MKSRLGLSKENAIFQATELMDKYGKALSQKLNKNILYSYYEQYDIRTSGYVPNVKEGTNKTGMKGGFLYFVGAVQNFMQL